MVVFVEKPLLTSLQVEVRPEFRGAFIDWQADFNTKIVNAKGFVSLEFLAPCDDRKSWLIVQRFVNENALQDWLNSETCQKLKKTLKTLILNQEIKEVESKASFEKGNITEVIVTEVDPLKEKTYRAWTAKIHQAEAKFPGFRGVYVQSPEDKGKYWITLLQFDTMKNLDHWLQSPERKEVLREAFPLISSLESHRVISPYAGWFASIAKGGKLPAVWKQTMLVLLVLFPIVILELKFLSPLTASLNNSLATFIGNALSVTLIAFPMMPLAIWLLGWWLESNTLKTTLFGTALILFLYLLEIALFWTF